MADEIKNENAAAAADQNNNDPKMGVTEEAIILKEYNKLKATSVPKEKYEADLKAANDKAALYLKAITEGNKVELPDEQNSSVSVKDAIAELSKFKGTNLEYWQKMTPTIDKILKTVPEEEITKIAGSEGLEEIIKVNEGMKALVKEANGDPDYFRTLYKNKVTESAPRIGSEIEKAGGVVNYFNNLQNKK